MSLARSGRQLGRPGRRRRPAGPPTWRNAKANKQETILSQHYCAMIEKKGHLRTRKERLTGQSGLS